MLIKELAEKVEQLRKDLTAEEFQDFVNCFAENVQDPVSDRRYRMFVDFKTKDPAQFNALSKGCKAAAELFMWVVEAENSLNK